MNIFSHSGDIGDLVYGLATIKACGGGQLVMYNHPGRTTHGMSEQKVARFKSLFEYQDYIHRVSFSYMKVDTDLNGFRDHMSIGNIVDMHLCTMGKTWHERIKPWLSVPDPITDYPVVIVKSPRHDNDAFNWKDVVDQYPQAVFIGLPEEHLAFERDIGPVKFVDCPDLMMVARVIAGSKIFISNPTCATAIGEAMKHPCMIVQVCPWAYKSTISYRLGYIHAWDTRIDWPKC